MIRSIRISTVYCDLPLLNNQQLHGIVFSSCYVILYSVYTYAHTLQANREVGILQELNSELELEAKELHNLADRMDVLPDDVISKHLWPLLVVQSVVAMAVFLVTCLWLCRANRKLERKLNAIQTTLSQPQNHLLPTHAQWTHSMSVASESTMDSQQKTDNNIVESCQLVERTKLSNSSQSSANHACSLSFTSVSDLRRQAENIGDLSRADLKHRTTNRSKSWQESGASGSGQNCCVKETPTVLSGGPLSSHSLSSLDDRRSTAEVSILLL